MNVDFEIIEIYNECEDLQICFAEVAHSQVDKIGTAMVLKNIAGAQYPVIADRNQLRHIRNAIDMFLEEDE